MKTRACITAVCAALAIPAVAHAQSPYPTKPVRVIIPYPPGGGADTIIRPIAQRLGETWKQQVIVDNRGGAGGNIGMELAAKAPPDGHTIVFALTAQLAVNPPLYKKVPYDPIRDFEPITLLGSGPYIILVHPSLPARSIKELIALARARPNQINYASSGSGSGGHLAIELLDNTAHVKMLHIPYKGGGAAMVATIAGEAQVLAAPYATAKPQTDAGRGRALAVTTSKRLTGVDLPTVSESGVPGFDAGVWYAFLAPAGTPREIVTKLHDDIVRVMRTPEVKTVLAGAAIEPIGSSPEELAKFMKSELAKWTKVVKEANVKVD
jgi:tripartite-type tricarboxylate transporter receptor subunit TctC